MAGVRIRHKKLSSCVALVPLPSKPLYAKEDDDCPTCHVVHQVKTIHLWLDGDGSCIVSTGVFEQLKEAKVFSKGFLPPWEPEFEILAEVANPPPLAIGVPRDKQDFEARGIRIHKLK